MRHLTQQDLQDVEARLVDLAEHKHDAHAEDAFLERLDNLLPAASVSTTEWAQKKRLIRGPTGEAINWRLEVTPYAEAPQRALDTPGVKIVALQANARFAKTVIFENKCMKHWDLGPSYNVLWYMQSKDDLADYVDERFDWMLENHTDVAAKIDWTSSKNGRFRKMIGDALLLMRQATLRTTRGKAAPLIGVDELDAYDKRVRNAMRTLIENRQREFGANAKAYFCSHPDAGPQGVAGIIADGLKHLWWWNCPHCRKSSSPCKGAEHRMEWNVPALLKRQEDLDRPALLEMIEQEARLVCPHCGGEVDEGMRLPMSNAGTFLQPHQTLDEHGVVNGEEKIAEIMGFVGHAHMSPFVNLGKLARAWAAAYLKWQDNGDDVALREETVKSLGEEYGGADAETQMEDWKVVKARLQSAFELKTVPAGVQFLTAFVDVQGDRFEVRVIGWNLAKESWLIDAYALKQWPGFDNIDPGGRLTDWDIIEDAVLNQAYPLASTVDSETPLFMPIAKTMVNAAGSPGVSNNARIWLANLVDPQRFARMSAEANPKRPARMPIESYRVQLFIGAAVSGKNEKKHENAKKIELYGRPKPVLVDDRGKQLAVQIYERALNVFEIKKIIAARTKIEEGPGRIHLSMKMSDRYVRELVSEKFINDTWVRSGANETWDGFVACEAARALLQPDRPGLWVRTPVWAQARPKDELHVDAPKMVSYYDRLRDLNRD